jgi:hypothetical protein
MKSSLAILADVANGVFAVFITAHLTSTDILWWHLFVGIALAMCPDLDAIPELLKRGKVAASNQYTHDHREALHFPVLFIVIGVVILQFNVYWGAMFLTATMLHFVNDLYGTGWGIPLFWPITNSRFKLLGRRANLLKSVLVDKGLWESLPHEERRLRLMVIWSHDELSEYIKKYGIDDWIERYYLRLNWISGIEYFLFILATGLVLFLWC